MEDDMRDIEEQTDGFVEHSLTQSLTHSLTHRIVQPQNQLLLLTVTLTASSDEFPLPRDASQRLCLPAVVLRPLSVLEWFGAHLRVRETTHRAPECCECSLLAVTELLFAPLQAQAAA
eukprot:m.465189 g.465189  ORF g.465189 m.465189 type:complete len:118 (+) comp57047_c0_seq9:607-960(+)